MLKTKTKTFYWGKENYVRDKKPFKKITTGFVVQNYVAQGDKMVCISQDFVAGDDVDYKDEFGDNVFEPDHEYCPMNMVQPYIDITE